MRVVILPYLLCPASGGDPRRGC